jgi:hypothetical protein
MSIAMENLHWELSVLSKAIHYKNLSGASEHVGLSQPQLSRIVSRLEADLNVVLLDRTARRKSGWTPVAFKIAETYFRNSRKLTLDLQQLQTETETTNLHIGTLEGLVPLATEFCQRFFEHGKMQLVELDVFDLSDLEEHFAKDELDLIFTCREPGKHKYKYIRNLGFQVFENIQTSGEMRVMSPFDYSHQMQKRTAAKDERLFLSNSLAVRKLWIEKVGGSGHFPSEVRDKKTGDKTETPVYLIASDMLSPLVWEKTLGFEL